MMCYAKEQYLFLSEGIASHVAGELTKLARAKCGSAFDKGEAYASRSCTQGKHPQHRIYGKPTVKSRSKGLIGNMDQPCSSINDDSVLAALASEEARYLRAELVGVRELEVPATHFSPAFALAFPNVGTCCNTPKEDHAPKGIARTPKRPPRMDPLIRPERDAIFLQRLIDTGKCDKQIRALAKEEIPLTAYQVMKLTTPELNDAIVDLSDEKKAMVKVIRRQIGTVWQYRFRFFGKTAEEVKRMLEENKERGRDHRMLRKEAEEEQRLMKKKKMEEELQMLNELIDSQ